jgi:Excreted virulence factor EspC, type VII ESX diderm
MNPDLTVDTTEVRATASGLAASGERVSAGAADPPDPVPAPRWATTDAAALATEAIRRQLARLGAGLTGIAREIDTTARDYQAADERSATRLRAAA